MGQSSILLLIFTFSSSNFFIISSMKIKQMMFCPIYLCSNFFILFFPFFSPFHIEFFCISIWTKSFSYYSFFHVQQWQEDNFPPLFFFISFNIIHLINILFHKAAKSVERIFMFFRITFLLPEQKENNKKKKNFYRFTKKFLVFVCWEVI